MTGAERSWSQRLTRFTSFNVAQQVWLAGLSLVATPVLYRGLGADAYGVLAVVTLVAAQLSILEFGFGHATIREVSRARALEDHTGAAKALATSVWVYLGTAAIGVTVLLTATDFLVERYFNIPTELMPAGRVALRIGAVFFAASLFGNLASAAWQGLQRFDVLNLVSGLAATCQILGSIGLVLAGFGVTHVVAWSALLATVVVVVHAVGIRRELPGYSVISSPDRDAFRTMASFGVLLMLAGVFTQVFLSGGPIVLGYFVSVGALPFFTVPFGLYQRLNRMAYGLASALYPLVAELEGKDDTESLGRVLRSGSRILVLMGSAAMFPAFLLAHPFLDAWMGAEFAQEAGPVLELLFLAFIVSLASVPAIELARGTGRAGRLVEYTGVLAMMNLLGIVVVAPRIGVLGAAAAFLVSQCVGSIWLLTRAAGMRGLAGVLTPRVVTLVLGGGALCALLYTNTAGLFSRGAGALVLGLLLLGGAYRWGLDVGERAVLRKMVGGS